MIDGSGYLDWGASPNSLSCNAAAWLYSLGFSLTFSSLFAKVYRVKTIFASALHSLKARVITTGNVATWVFAGVFVELLVLTAWVLSSPLRWVRRCEEEDEFGFCTESAGHCENVDSWPFVGTILAMHFLALLYACMLCYQTRRIPTNLAEGRWISMSIVSNLQILMLGVPLLFLVENYPTAAFLVRTIVLFLNDASVILFMFAPKIWSQAAAAAAASASHTSPTPGNGKPLAVAANAGLSPVLTSGFTGGTAGGIGIGASGLSVLGPSSSTVARRKDLDQDQDNGL